MIWGGFRITQHTFAAGVVAAAALLLPAHAGATTTWKTGDTIAVASGSESSSVKLSRQGSDIVVADASGTVTAGSGCSKSNGRNAKCPAADVDRVVAVLGGGADTLDATSATLSVSAWGGEGDDTLLMRNGFTDYVSCGDGDDSGAADAGDSLADDCEGALTRPIGATPVAAPAPEPQPEIDDVPEAEPTQDGEPVGDNAPATTGSAPITINTGGTVALTPQGVLAVPVTCTADEGACAGTIEIVEEAGALKARTSVQAARRRKPQKKAPATVLGRARFSVRAGAAKRVQVRLSRRGRQRVIKKKKRKTRAKIVVSMRAPDGTVTTTEKKVSIAAPRERRTSARRGSKKSSSKKTGRR